MANKKVLIIDDNPVVVRLNEAFLKSAGYDCISATDGKEGLHKAKTQHPDIILLDIIMPKMHGYELCHRLKSDPQTQSIPVILITGSGLEDIAKNEPVLHAADCLRKPYTAEELNKAIEKALKSNAGQAG